MSESDNKPSANELISQAQNRLIEHLRSSEKRYSDLVEHLRDVVFKVDSDFNWLYLNRAWKYMSGFSTDETIGHPFVENVRLKDSHLCLSGFKNLISGRITDLTLQIHLIGAEKQERVLELSCRAYKNEVGENEGIAGILTDITQRIEAERKIVYLAYHDSLTGLANRRLLLDHIQENAQKALEEHCYHGLIFIDLDNFKQINDIHGHVLGDMLLCNVAQKLKQLLERQNSLISRIGGDEFVICVELDQQGAVKARSSLIEVCEQLKQVLAAKAQLGIVSVSITASIGCVLLDGDQQNYEVALKCADAAVCRAKHKGRNTIQFYDQDFEREEQRQRSFKNEIESAIQNNDFELFYQPQIDINTNTIVKVEALIRWRHPEKGLILPDDFIPYLESSGLIIEVGSWVLEEGCRELAKWAEQGITDICMSINVSAHQFMKHDFVLEITELLNKYDIPPHLIELELTEGVAVADIELTISRMTMINQLGMRIALDDFGTGYSSLAYLKYFPIHTLKIDKSFVQGVPNDGYDAAIIETTMVMSKHLGLTVVAEGVEDLHQLAFLKELGCQLYQGFLHSKPLPREELLAQIAQGNQTVQHCIPAIHG
jgi:diguanylate cyclase (GGDEF)-like protein/PAS domain S-box-containing protein